MRVMRDDRVGRIVRALRVRNGWRQADLAARAGVSQRLIAELELGRLEGVTVGRIRRVGAALDVTVDVDAWWRRGDIDRLLDRGHAAIVEYVMRRLAAGGWVTLAEVTFNHYGERGSVDIVAWHPPTGTLLLIEVKTLDGTDADERLRVREAFGQLLYYEPFAAAPIVGEAVIKAIPPVEIKRVRP